MTGKIELNCMIEKAGNFPAFSFESK